MALMETSMALVGGGTTRQGGVRVVVMWRRTEEDDNGSCVPQSLDPSQVNELHSRTYDPSQVNALHLRTSDYSIFSPLSWITVGTMLACVALRHGVPYTCIYVRIVLYQPSLLRDRLRRSHLKSLGWFCDMLTTVLNVMLDTDMNNQQTSELITRLPRMYTSPCASLGCIFSHASGCEFDLNPTADTHGHKKVLSAPST